MRNTVSNRTRCYRQLSTAMKAGTDPALAGAAWLKEFERRFPQSAIIDDLFSYYDGVLLGLSLAPPPKKGLPSAIGVLLSSLGVGLAAVILTYVLLSNVSLQIKLLVGIGTSAAAVTLIVLVKAQHLYKLSLLTTGAGLIAAPFFPEYGAQVSAEKVNASPPVGAVDAGIHSSALTSEGVAAIVIGGILMVIAAFLHYRESHR